MIKSFLTITLRILWRNKVTSFVNIFSLSVGITSFIFIMLYVYHETSYDTFNENYDRIYRLEGDDYAKLPPSVGTFLQDRLPEIKAVAQLARMFPPEYSQWRMTYADEHNPEKIKYALPSVAWADSSVFTVFSFNFVKGDPATCLRYPFKAVITEEVAKILFGDEDAMGKVVKMDDQTYEITGIIQDVHKSHFEVGAFLSMPSLQLTYPERDLNLTGPNSWLWSATYLLTVDEIDEEHVQQKINSVLAEINDGRLFDTVFKKFHLRPLSELYFSHALAYGDYGLHGNNRIIGILIAIGILLLTLACINYVNLTTARSVTRTREIAIKRVNGSSAGLIRAQLILESILVTVIAFAIALTTTQIFVHGFNVVAGIDVHLGEWNRAETWIGSLAAIVLLGSLAGVYPAFYLTKIKPVAAMKKQSIEGTPSISSRSILMVAQFTLSIVMTICAMAFLRQLNYLRHADLGFSKEEIVQVVTPDDIEQQFVLRKTFREVLHQSSQEILGVSFSAGSPGSFIPAAPYAVEGKEQMLDFFLVDYDYLEVMGIELVQGIPFPERAVNTYDSGTLAIVNESFVRQFKMENPLGKILYSETPAGRGHAEIVGIVKDFHMRSLHHKIDPIILLQAPPMHIASLKIRTTDIGNTLKTIEQAWKKVYGDRPFEYSFLNETLDRQYKDEEQMATLIGWFTGIALVIACLGLFALSSLMTNRRKKEIGIRKSLGASIGSIYGMLTWNFLKWIALAIIIACPISWYAMHVWLSKFAYHITPGTGIFIIAAALALVVALLTITWQSWKVARGNPVDALKCE